MSGDLLPVGTRVRVVRAKNFLAPVLYSGFIGQTGIIVEPEYKIYPYSVRLDDDTLYSTTLPLLPEEIEVLPDDQS